jgi:hypothetical protein
MRTFCFLSLFWILFTAPAMAQKKVAVVKLLRGDADILSLGKTIKLKADDWVSEGHVVRTADKSFVKLVFIDKSQMNVGPNSEMKIENFSGKDSGVIDLVKGKIRSQVTKDYLQMEDRDKSKLFIKTANAVMGVRGTDFMISTNGKTSSVVLFAGEVVFNKLDDRRTTSSGALEQIVDRGVRMFPGEFSVVDPNRQPTVPSLLNVQQRETLEKNDSFEANRGSKEDASRSVVPEGLSGGLASNNSETIKKEVGQVSAATDKTAANMASSANPDGYVVGEKLKPSNGSFLHLDSGVIIPPAPDSILDQNTNTYVAGSGNGTIASNGDYVPPKNMEISNDGKIMVSSADGKTVRELSKPIPIINVDGGSLTKQADTRFVSSTPPPPNPQNDILNHAASSNYGTQNGSNIDLMMQNQIENTATRTRTTIRVNTGAQ